MGEKLPRRSGVHRCVLTWIIIPERILVVP